MTRYIHQTNNASTNAPSTSEINEGEICINTRSLGATSNGISSGRLYIKTSAGEIRRFISIGLSSSSDPSLKTKYGGTNNTFSSVLGNDDSGDSLVVFKHDNNGDHSIDKTDENKLTWRTSNSRLNINRSAAALATVHIGGNLAVDTVDSVASFTPQIEVLMRSTADNNIVKKVLSTDFMSLVPSVSTTKLSGVVPLTNGGTGANLSSNVGSDNGSIVYFSGTTLTYNSNFKWDNPNSTLVLNGAFNFNPPNDVLNNASPIGVDGSNKIVRMDYSYNQDLNIDDDVTFNTLTLDNNGFDIGVLTVNNMGTDGSPYNAVPVGVDSSDRIVKMYYTYNQDLNTTSNTIFNKITIDNSSNELSALVISNIQTISAATILGIDGSDQVVKTGFTTDQSLETTDTVQFEKITINGGTGAGDTLVLTNIESNTGGVALEIIGSNVYKSSSTRRLKENIIDYDKGLETVLLMNPKYFNMINDPSKKIRAGLIAEDLADIGLNEFVTRDEDDNPSGITYDKLIVLLINAIKELKNRIDNISSN